ncbi:Sodium/hydrogen exchanger family protein [uncultured archaeon]|nr:Sodium/hydrogen exchanger family protein [uncultured archaeon]
MAGNRIKKDLSFLREFFLLFFFVVFGSTLFYNTATGKLALPNTQTIINLVGIAAIITVLMILIHFSVFSYFGKKFGLNSENSSTAAIMLTPLGEFAIIIAAASQQVLGSSEAQLIGPLAFLMVIISLLTFKPLYSLKEHHKKLSEILRGKDVVEPVSQENLLAHTHNNHRLLKSVFLNFLIILSLLAIAFNFYYVTPKDVLGFQYSTQITYLLLFLLFSSYSFIILYRDFKMIVRRASSVKERGEVMKPF